MEYPSDKNNYLIEHALLLSDSYQHFLSKQLLEGTNTTQELAYQLFHASFALVSHNIASEPVFNYANLKALELFELSWEEFTRLPSRLSAEPINQTERARLLAEVTKNGYIDHYEGVRISSTGKHFIIKNAVVWNLIDAEGNYKGQAASFGEWTFL
jgi:hypothetical protein